MSEVLLQALGIGIDFGGLRALGDFHLEIRRGDLKALIGPNGAGKTTAFNVLTGVYRPTRGEVRLSGLRVDGSAPHRINRMGMARTFQNIRLFKQLTVLDNVRVARVAEKGSLFSADKIRELRRSGGGGALAARALEALDDYRHWWRALFLTPAFVSEEQEIERSCEELLDLMGLLHRRDVEASSLPYGEQRRLEIARALATKPKVLLLDEPAAGMNSREKVELMSLIRGIRDRFSLGVLLIEHDMKLVMEISEQITVLDHGEMIAVGPPEQIRRDPKVIEAYLGESFVESHSRGGAA